MTLSFLLQCSYKKLKASVYLDKTQFVLRNKIVAYETEHDIDRGMDEIAEKLRGEEEDWIDYRRKLLKSVKALTLPKTIKDSENRSVTNITSGNVKVTQVDYFIDMDVEAHLLGILWVMEIGNVLDKNFSDNSYGNRLKRYKGQESDLYQMSPYLFYPYFQQYEKWRDKGLKRAQQCLKDKENVLIMTLDLKRCFYSVHFDESMFEKILEQYQGDEKRSNQGSIYTRLNDFTFDIIKCYSGLFDEHFFNGRNILPIGFFPSNILSNWYLEFFDKKIIDSWNPTYYGRYVDDIIIVDKVDNKSEIYDILKNNGSDVEEKVIEHFLCTGPDKKDCILERKVKDTNTFHCSNCQLHEGIMYKVCNVWDYKSSEEPLPDVQIQNKKVQVFFFDYKGSDALITCFRENIAQNASEFRLLPQDDAIQHGDYSSIYKMFYEDTINKLSGVKQITIDKFNLAKFLGRNLKINTLIQEEKLESRFVSDLGKIFGPHALIQNYRQWEQILHILIIEEQLDALKEFCNNLMRAINTIVAHYKSPVKNIIDIKDTLKHVFASALYRAIAINWRIKIEDLDRFKCGKPDNLHSAVEKCFTNNFYTNNLKSIKSYRVGYCKTRMINKFHVPGLIDSLLESGLFSDDNDLLSKTNLANINNIMNVYPRNFKKYLNDCYKYYPYIIKPQELIFDLQIRKIVSTKSTKKDLKELESQIKNKYRKLNFPYDKCHCSDADDKEGHANEGWLEEIQSRNFPFTLRYPKIKKDNILPAIKIGKKRKNEFKIAVANARINESNLKKVLTGKPDRSFERYNKLANIINQAVKSKADILILPEAYVPFEWIPSLAIISAKNQMAIVSGVEHILHEDKVYNLTAVILPYEKKDEYRFVHIDFHEKIYFAPGEAKQICGYNAEPECGESNKIYVWNDLWFSVYCCYEIASVFDRSLFRSYIDLAIIVEWNKDVNYFSNIVESLSRDLHCYCAQVNIANYGDSRIVQPTATVEKDVLRTKGGINDTILVGKINIKKLREFQLKSHILQQDDDTFKITPPGFDDDKNIVRDKISGSLWKKNQK